MANREALKELQARLAKRLQAAQSEGMAVSWLAVRAGGGNYLLPLSQSGEIVSLTSPQPVPYSKGWFRGVLNIRGNLYGVADLARFLSENGGAPVTPAQPADAAGGTEGSVVTLNAQLEVNCALQVDSLAGLRGADGFVASSPAPEGLPEFFGPRHVDAQGQSWQELNLRALAQAPQFLNIGA